MSDSILLKPLFHTCQTLKEYNNNNKIFYKKKIILNKKFQFYFPLLPHKDITDCLDLFLELKNKLAKNNWCWIGWNKIKIPEKLKLSLENKVKIDDFCPSNFYFDNNAKKKLNMINNIVFSHMFSMLNIKPSNEILLLFDELKKELLSFNLSNNTNKKLIEDTINIKNTIHSVFSTGDYYILNSTDSKQYMFLSNYTTCIFAEKYILIIPTYPEEKVKINSENINSNYLLITDKQFYFKKNDMNINFKYTFDTLTLENVVFGYIKDRFKKELFNIRTNYKCNLKKNYKYINKETNMVLNSYSFYDREKRNEYHKYNKNNCDFEEYYDYNNNLKHVISQCMITDDSTNTGIRYRGKYIGTSKDGNIIRKSIQIDDELKYLLEGDEVKVDTLENKTRKSEEGFIAYKIAKSKEGELRIVKLFVPPDAKVVRPIDEEYFINFGKERCDKAIVMDIQLPVKDNEISLVPEEMVAYSYIHKINGTNSFEYNVGQEVFPDDFNPDENIGCGKGLHFFQGRLTVFKAFIDNV